MKTDGTCKYINNGQTVVKTVKEKKMVYRKNIIEKNLLLKNVHNDDGTSKKYSSITQAAKALKFFNNQVYTLEKIGKVKILHSSSENALELALQANLN